MDRKSSLHDSEASSLGKLLKVKRALDTSVPSFHTPQKEANSLSSYSKPSCTCGVGDVDACSSAYITLEH